ncbi:MAG: hypothetical protein ABEL76_14430 [Bradymonadaceae bacterium]
MAIRLRLERGGESSEFVFDRAEITVGGEPFHDIVLEEHHAEEVRGAVRVKEERIEFESRICNVRTRLLRDGRAVETIAPDSERRVDVRSGDTLEFDVEPGVVLGVEGFERASEKAPTVEPLDVEGFTEAEEAPPDQLWEAWQRVVEEPTPQTYVETVADAIATAVGERPSLVCLTVSERGGGLRVERASIRAEGDEAGDGRGEWEHREVAGRLSPGDVARLASGGRTTLYSRLDGESSTALLEVDLPGGVDDRDLEQPARWLASLRRLGSSVVLASERRRECRSLAEENRYF